MKRRKIISILIWVFFVIWFFQYYLSFIQGAYTIVVWLIGLILWFILLGIATYQLIKLTIEDPKHFKRLNYVAVILILNFIALANPKGLIDWEKYEGENLLVAEREGTANCRTIIKLRENNRFKYINSCFGIDFYFGTYKVKDDTLYFELQNDVGFMDKSSFATLLKSSSDSSKFQQIILHKNFEDKRSVSFIIRELQMNKLANEK